MDAGGLAQMSHQSFAMPGSGLASRRGGQSLKPLSFDSLKASGQDDASASGLPTPRTSRSHLLAGLRTAPKTATAATFANNLTSASVNVSSQADARSSVNGAMLDGSSLSNGPKTSYPRLPGGPQQQMHKQGMGYGPQYTADQILAPPELNMEEHLQDQMDPNLQAQLLAANAYLSEQQQRLQQQLMNLQAAAQHFQGLSLNGQYQAMQQAAYAGMYNQQQHYQQQQQQQLKNMQSAMAQPPIYTVYDPVTGQQTLYVDQSQAQHFAAMQMPRQQAAIGTPRVQVSPPPPEDNHLGFRNTSPPRRFGSPMQDHAPLPPPSANAFRRGHRKLGSVSGSRGLSIGTHDELPKSAGPRTATFPATPTAAGYGPGQARAGEHPTRQPRNPPSLDELKSKPTAKHEGSKNFVTRTRREAVHNLVRAGLERRKEARSSGSASPVSESADELVETPMTDNESDSGRSGSGSLVDVDDADCSLPSSRTSTGSWGAIGSDRPSSRQNVARNSVDSTNSLDLDAATTNSFASVFKKANRSSEPKTSSAHRKAPMLVLTSADKRKVVA